jgi:hypothetical protein
MHRLAGLAHLAAVAPRVRHGLGVDQMRFDVPQAVFALIACALDVADVYGFAGLVRG